jgi:uncharacterized iron-regulated membrane protein
MPHVPIPKTRADANEGIWQRWLHRPERVWLRQIVFQIHFWVGALVGAHIFVMSVTGSVIVFRGELYAHGLSVERVAAFHRNLLAGGTGRLVNGIGAVTLVLLCLTGAVIWWPGLAHWRRSLTVEWRASFARVNWDVHSAFGFWSFLFVLEWGLSGAYLTYPNQFSAFFFVDSAGPITGWLADLHFGRFSLFTKIVWTVVGLVPAVLAFTGVFICCRRIMFHKPSNPKHFLP